MSLSTRLAVSCVALALFAPRSLADHEGPQFRFRLPVTDVSNGKRVRLIDTSCISDMSQSITWSVSKDGINYQFEVRPDHTSESAVIKIRVDFGGGVIKTIQNGVKIPSDSATRCTQANGSGIEYGFYIEAAEHGT